MTTPPSLYEPLHLSPLKPINGPWPPPIYSQPDIKIKRKPVSGGYSHSYHPSLSSSLIVCTQSGLEVVESHGPEVTGGDGLIFMRDDDKHLSIQLPSWQENIVDEEGSKTKRRICGMNVWVVIALVVFLVIGAVVGGAVGAIKARSSTSDSVATGEPVATLDSTPTTSSDPESTSQATDSPTPKPKPKPSLPQPIDNTWYIIGTSNTSLSRNTRGLYLTRDSGGSLRCHPPTKGFEQDQTFRFKSFQSSSSSANKITQTWSAAQINFQNLYNIPKETPLYILQHPLAKWSAILRYTNENGLGDLYLESANYANNTSSMHNDPAVWFWLEDREDRKGFYLKNVAAGRGKALTLLNYNGKDQLVLSDLGITGVRAVDVEGVQAWNITETPEMKDYKWPYKW